MYAALSFHARVTMLSQLQLLLTHPAPLLWPLVFWLLSRLCRRMTRLSILFALPGTVLHEAAHWCVGLLLGAQPRQWTVIPQIQQQHIRLGQVSFARLRWWNALPVGLAPLMLLPIGVWLVLSAGQGALLHPLTISRGYLALQCCAGCCPSRTDLAHAGRSALAYALFGAGIWCLARLLA